MKKTARFLAVALLFQLASAPALEAGGHDPFSVVFERDGAPVWVERRELIERIDAAASHGEALADKELAALIQDFLAAQVAGPTPDEAAGGIRPLFPEDTRIDTVEVRDGRGTMYLTLPEPFPASREDEVLLEALAHLTVAWGNGISGLRSLVWRVRSADTAAYHTFEAFLPAAPPPASKMDPYGEDDAAEPVAEPLAATAEATPSSQPSVRAQPRPSGSLNDASIFLSPGHGWYVSGGSWVTQRVLHNGIIEDHSNAEAVLQFLNQYLWNAGANIYTTRERDMNTNMVIVNHTDDGYEETGSWTTESAGGTHGGSHRRATTVTGEPTASATFTPDIPEAGHYAVYAWYRRAVSGSTTEDARITINHTGDSTPWVQNQNHDGFTWKYVGTYYFDEGFNPETGSVTFSNESETAGNQVVANAVRFGGGMGDLPDNVTGTISGKPRWEESGRYYAGFMGKGDWASSNQVNAMPRYAAWEHENWQAGRSIYLSWHTNGFNGTARGTETFAYSSEGWNGSFDGVPGGDKLRDAIQSNVIDDIRANWDSTWPSRNNITANLGEINPSNNPHMPAALVEIGFHDNATDAQYLLDPEFRREMARAVYKGIIEYYVNEVDGFDDPTLVPEPPEALRVEKNDAGEVTLSWDAPPVTDPGDGDEGGRRNSSPSETSNAATGYRLYQSSNGKGFDNGADVTGTTATVSGLNPGEIAYFRVTGTNSGGESFPTSTLAVRVGEDGPAPLLLVNGFNRLDRHMNIMEGSVSRGYLDRMNTFDYIIQHANAIANHPAGIGFDSAEAAAVGNGSVDLNDYRAILWMAGVQAEDNPINPRDFTSLPADVRSRLDAYLRAGGRLFISGSEIAWDLGRSGSGTFVDQTLRASYQGRNAGVFSARGAAGSIFEGIDFFSFDDGSGETYGVKSPDVIASVGDANAALGYGTPGGGTIDGFESIGGWQQPTYSGQSNAHPDSSFTIVGHPVLYGNGSGHLHYIWGDGDRIRLFNASQPLFPTDSDFSLWIHGDNSGHLLRIVVRDQDGRLFRNSFTPIDFTGWRELVWEDVRNNAEYWTAGPGSADVIPTDSVAFDSIDISRTPGGPSSGSLYFDEATHTPTAEDDSPRAAAVQYDGDYRLVYLAFPFETITAEPVRNDLLARSLEFFGVHLAPFDAWRAEQFTEAELSDPSVSGDTASPAGDGIPNLVKYAMGLDPRTPSRDAMPGAAMVDGHLTLSYTRRTLAPDVDYVVEVSENLRDWFSGNEYVEEVEANEQGNRIHVTVRDREPAKGNTRSFIRLRVVRD